jgi:hypothetical protein
LNNYNIINFINNKILLDKRFFIFCKNIFDIVKADISIFPIIGQGRRIFKNTLNNTSSLNIEDFIFHNVYMVEGFHINIISKVCFKVQEI